MENYQAMTNVIIQTGTFPFNAGVLIPSRGPPPHATWAVTLVGGIPENTTADYSLWYNTGGLDYSNSLELGYDVCAISLSPRGIYNDTNLRARHDDGSCQAAFDSECVVALKQQSQDIAMQLVGEPTALPESNLTANSLPGVCNTLAQTMMSTLPEKCRPYIKKGEYQSVGATG